MTDEFIFEILEKFNNSQIVDLDLAHQNEHISLRKKEAFVAGAPVANQVVTSASPSSSPATETVTEKTVESAPVAKKTEAKENKVAADVLKSPIVGTFYRAPSPDSPAYAEKGSKIKKGEPVCIIEAMKMMNTLNADYDFEVLDVLVENGQLVEFDQPLFSIKKL